MGVKLDLSHEGRTQDEGLRVSPAKDDIWACQSPGNMGMEKTT